MSAITHQIHIKNMLSCLSEIERYCVDVTQQQLKDPELLNPLLMSFTILGLEAENSRINHPIISMLTSFKHADFKRDIMADRYALYSFIANDIGLVKNTLIKMRRPATGKTSKSKLKLAS